MRSLRDIFRNTSQRTAEGTLTRENVALRTAEGTLTRENVAQRTFENVFDIEKDDDQFVGMLVMGETGEIRRVEGGVCYIGPSPAEQLRRFPSVSLGIGNVNWLNNFTSKWGIKKYVIEGASFDIYLKKDTHFNWIPFEADDVILYSTVKDLTIVRGLNVKSNSLTWNDRSKNFGMSFRECNIECNDIISTTREFPTFMYCDVKANMFRLDYGSNTRIDEYIEKGDLKTPFKDLKIDNNSNLDIKQLAVGTGSKTYFFWDASGKCKYRNAVIKV